MGCVAVCASPSPIAFGKSTLQRVATTKKKKVGPVFCLHEYALPLSVNDDSVWPQAPQGSPAVAPNTYASLKKSSTLGFHKGGGVGYPHMRGAPWTRLDKSPLLSPP